MPNYDFKCLDCGHKFQKLLPVGHPEQLCLECNSATEKLLTAPGVQFKSPGFYKTDSKSDSGSNRKASNDGSSRSSSGGDNKTKKSET